MIMNAAEIIQEIERLPEEERGKVVEFMEELRSLKNVKRVRHVDAKVFKTTAEKVFREHAPVLEKLAR